MKISDSAGASFLCTKYLTADFDCRTKGGRQVRFLVEGRDGCALQDESLGLFGISERVIVLFGGQSTAGEP